MPSNAKDLEVLIFIESTKKIKCLDRKIADLSTNLIYYEKNYIDFMIKNCNYLGSAEKLNKIKRLIFVSESIRI